MQNPSFEEFAANEGTGGTLKCFWKMAVISQDMWHVCFLILFKDFCFFFKV
jgi:hypothetical protein